MNSSILTKTIVPTGIAPKEAIKGIVVDEQGNLVVPGATISKPSHEIIALVGLPGSGKTTACKTFPAPRLWVDFDHKLPAGEQTLDLWSAEFCDVTMKAKRTFPSAPPNRRDALRAWLREYGSSIPENATFIIDSWTIMQNSFDQQTQQEEDLAAKPNPFSFWKRKAAYAIEVCEMLKACKCRVVVTFHETIERNEEGDPTGKIRPVMDGGFKDQLLGHFTDAWHQVCNPLARDDNGKYIMDGNKPRVNKGFFWELIGSDVFNTNTNPNLGEKVRRHNIRMVPADYKEIQKIYAME